MSDDQQTIQDDGDLRKWRTEVPNIIDDLGLDPYERTLYTHYKKVCGANGGQCTEGVRATAQKTGMSTAKVSLTRRELVGRGLIETREQPPRPDFIEPQIFVKVVDIWELNFYFYSTKGRPDIAGWTIKQLREWQVSVYDINATGGERLPDKQERLPDKRLRLRGKQKKESKEHESNSPPRDFLGDVLAYAQKPKSQAGIADPSQDIELYWQYKNEAVKIYAEKSGKAPPPANKKAIEAMVKDGFDSVLWGNVITAYIGNGWNPSNVNGMIEYYERGEVPPPTAKGRNGNAKPTAQRPVDNRLDPTSQAISDALAARARPDNPGANAVLPPLQAANTT